MSSRVMCVQMIQVCSIVVDYCGAGEHKECFRGFEGLKFKLFSAQLLFGTLTRASTLAYAIRYSIYLTLLSVAGVCKRSW